MPLHVAAQDADVIVMEPVPATDGESPHHDPAEAAVGEVEGDHPDPVTLCSPSYDDEGLLRWGSIPVPGARGG